jgi:hypothetical protein
MDLVGWTRRSCTTDQDPILGNDHNDASTDMILRTWRLLSCSKLLIRSEIRVGSNGAHVVARLRTTVLISGYHSSLYIPTASASIEIT